MSLMHTVECDACATARVSTPPHIGVRTVAQLRGWTTTTELLPNGGVFVLDICPTCQLERVIA